MSIARLGGALALLLGLSLLGVSAQAQDGLQRFEKEIKPQFQFKSFTYAKGTPLGDKGFELQDVTVVVPAAMAGSDKDSTVKIEKVTVDEVDFDRLKSDKDDVPLFARLKIEGMAADDDLSGTLQGFGVPKVPVDLALDYRLDPTAKVLTLNKLELGLRGQGTLTASLVLEGVSDKTSEAADAKDKSRLRTASLQYTDIGLLAQLLPAVAKQQGSVPEAMIAMVVAPIGAFAASQGPETTKALDAIVSFVSDWEKPQGPLKLSITPTRSASFADLDKVSQPNALSDIFGLKAEYAGTRAGAAGGAAAASGERNASAATPSGGGDGKAVAGAEAWLSIIGNTLTGKIDGDLIFEYYRKDGTLTLMEGDELTKGKWSLEGEKICFKYPDEDKDCLTLSRTGDEVTFLRKDGSGHRLKLLQGNPKNL